MGGRVITVAEDLSRVRYELAAFLAGGAFELYEDGRRLAEVEPAGASADVSYNKLILACWGEGWSRAWRVLGCETLAGALRLECAKQMGLARCAVELRRGPRPQGGSLPRHDVAQKLAALIAAHFPDCRVTHAVTARDDRHHLSGRFARFLLKEQGRDVAALGVGPDEPQGHVDAALGAGLVWLDELRRRQTPASRLLLFAPRGRATTIATRLTAARPADAAVSLYEVDWEGDEITPVVPFDQGDLADNLRRAAARAEWPHHRSLPEAAASAIAAIVDLAPDLIEARRRGGWFALSINGLEFARVSAKEAAVEFGPEGGRQRLEVDNRAALTDLVSEIIQHRRAAAPDLNHAFYRAQPERWLEGALRRDIAALDPTLDPRFAYAQVPAYRGEQRAYIDLLAATRDGRLVVMELKVSEDAEFPFQGLDYWLRVEWHRRRGDFGRRGYFGGLRLADAPPLLYLVAPLFRFHATTGLLAGSITSDIPVYRVGINEDWRAGVRVLLRERLN